jgi:hypothetical protein
MKFGEFILFNSVHLTQNVSAASLRLRLRFGSAMTKFCREAMTDWWIQNVLQADKYG